MPGPVAAFLSHTRLPGEAPPSPTQANPGDLAKPAERDKIVVLAEKVRSATLAGQVSFLPYLDTATEETDAMLRAYPLMMRNDVVKQALAHKVSSVAALDLQMIPASKAKRDHEVADFARYAYTEAIEGNFPALAEEVLMPMLMLKSVVAEKVWHPDLRERGKFAGKRFYRCLKAKKHVTPLYDEFLNFVGAKANGFGQNEVFPAEDFVFMKNIPIFGGPGMSDLRAAYGKVWQLDTIEKLHLIHLEKFLSPVMTATYTPDFNDAYLPGLEADLAAVKSRGWLLTPESVQVEAMTLATSGPAEFLAKTKDLREQIALSITGAYLQMLTAVSGGDIRGNSKVQQSTAELLIWALAAKLAAALNSQATPQLIRENYAGADYPKMELGSISYAEMLQAIQIDETALRMGIKVSASGTARKYSIQVAVDDDDILVPVPPPAPPGMGGPNGDDPGPNGKGDKPPNQNGKDKSQDKDQRSFDDRSATDEPAHQFYDPSQLRDEGGKWTAGGSYTGVQHTSAAPAGAHPGSTHGSSVKVKPSKDRAFTGEPAVLKTTLTKQETGRVGEAVVLAYLKSKGLKDARPMNTGETNFPVDMIEDHALIEIKAGLASNRTDAQKWRLTFSKESAAEKEWYDKASPDERTAWNAEKQRRIHERKEKVLKAIQKETGKKMKRRTITVILNPDTHTADIYQFDGWHDSIRWRSDEAKKAYVGSVKYS